MPQWLIAELKMIVPSLFVAVLTAIVTVRLSLGRFRSERWWERKADAYSRIVEALHGAMEYCSARADEAMMYRELRQEKKRQLEEEYDRAISELKKATGIGAYIISDEVAEVLSRLQSRPEFDPNEVSLYEIFDTDSADYRKVLSEVKELAKKDLGVRHPWKWWFARGGGDLKSKGRRGKGG